MVQISRGEGLSYAQQPACSHERAPPLAHWEPSGAPRPGRSVAQEPLLATPLYKAYGAQEELRRGQVCSAAGAIYTEAVSKEKCCCTTP